MERFLTRRARPLLLVVLLEIVTFAALLIWCTAVVAVLFEKYIHQLTGSRMTAFLLVFGAPALVGWRLIGRWHKRRQARKIASVLDMASAEQLSWAQFEQDVSMHEPQLQNVRALVVRLWVGKYLCSIVVSGDGLQLCPADMPALDVPNGGKCEMCGAQLEKRLFGGWACRYCGTVVGKK